MACTPGAGARTCVSIRRPTSDRSAATHDLDLRENNFGLGPNLIIGGLIAGSWKRKVKATKVDIAIPSDDEVQDFTALIGQGQNGGTGISDSSSIN